MQFKQFIDHIAIDLQFSRNFASIENIKRRYNSMVDLSKFTFNKKILNNFVTKLCSIISLLTYDIKDGSNAF